MLLNYVVLRALLKIDVHLISTLVNKSIYEAITGTMVFRCLRILFQLLDTFDLGQYNHFCFYYRIVINVFIMERIQVKW